MKSAYEKVIKDIESGKHKGFDEFIGKPQKDFIISVLKGLQENIEAEQTESNEVLIVDRFYSDIPKEEAIKIVNEIIDKVEHYGYAAKLVRMFVNNRIPVDRVERLINHGLE